MKQVLFIFILLATSVRAQSTWFSSPVNYSIAGNPAKIVCRDINADGNLDLISTLYNAGLVAVQLGTGSGTFATATTFSVGGSTCGPLGLVCADFNGDGNPDIATANNNSGNISVLLGNGAGSFGSASTYTTGSMPVALTTADFNQDGVADIAVVNSNGSSIRILSGTGTGSFTGTATYMIGLGPVSIANADFNNDGKQDLVAVNGTSNSLSILLGTGTGTFTGGGAIGLVGQPHWVATADLNTDGNMDMAVSNINGDINVFIGNGNGTFLPYTNYATGTWPNSPYCQPYDVIIDDLNNDGIPDLATANKNENSASILLGTGSGSFNAAMSFSVQQQPYGLASGDFNGDNKKDLAVANFFSSSVSILTNVPPPACWASVAMQKYYISPLNWGMQVLYSSQITSAVWSWGDGTTTNALYPSHTYSAAGWYTICVTAYASCGDSASSCRTDTLYKVMENNSMINVNVVAHDFSIQEAEQSDYAVYPSPFEHELHIRFASVVQKDLVYELVDVTGRALLRGQSCEPTEELVLQTSEIPRGVYVLLLSGRDLKTGMIKVVK